jgi:vitamin B12 transporter
MALPAFRLPLCIALGVSSVLPASADAQARDSVPPADSVFSVEPLLVTASRLPGVGARLGLTVTSLDVRPSSGSYAADWLRVIPGAFIDEASGPGGPSIVRLRGGEEVFTQILVDGVQINQNGGYFDFQGLALSNVASVEVARGPQSAVYGSSAVSGVVHFLTPRGHVGKPEVRILAEGGAATEEGGAWRTEASVRGGSERVRYSAGLGGAFSRGVFALPHNTHTRDGALRLDWAAGSGVEVTLTGRRVEMSSNQPVRDPGATRVPLDPNARNTRDRDVGAVTVRFSPGGAWSHYVRASRYSEAFVYEDQADGISGPPDDSFFVFDASYRFTSDLVRNNVEVGGSYAAPSVRAAYGIVADNERLQDRITGDFGGDPVVLDRSSWAGFGELAWSPVLALTVGAGLRVERYEGLAAEATPRATVAWRPGTSGVTLRGAVGRAYKAPNMQQQYVDNPFIVANPDLRAETSTSWELGVDLAPRGRDWTLGVTAFRQAYDDLIRTVGIEGDTRQINRNLGRARAEGVEWHAGARLAGGLRLSTQGTLLRTEIVDAVGLSPSEYPEGDELPFRPSATGTVALSYRAATGPDLTVSVRGVGAQTVLSERFSGARVEIPGYALVGVTAAQDVMPGLRVFVRLDNALDRDFDTAFDRAGIPATGSVGMALRFR